MWFGVRMIILEWGKMRWRFKRRLNQFDLMGLEVAGRSLGHQPRHGSREIVVVTAALSTCDPGSILTETIPRLQQASIRVSCFALAAELHVCRKVAEETKGTMGVCLDKAHCREWLRQQTVPPPASKKDAKEGQGPVCEMIPMGFPTRVVAEVPALIHADRNKTVMGRTAFSCPQCRESSYTLRLGPLHFQSQNTNPSLPCIVSKCLQSLKIPSYQPIAPCVDSSWYLVRIWRGPFTISSPSNPLPKLPRSEKHPKQISKSFHPPLALCNFPKTSTRRFW